MRAHMAELGIVAAIGRASISKLILALRDHQDVRLPPAARAALLEMAEQIEMLTACIEKLERKIVAAVRADETARRLTSIPGVGPTIAATVRTTIQDPAGFRTGRALAAWIGITPQAHSSGGKERLGRISKRGNKQLRTLLIVGVTSWFLRQMTKPKHSSILNPESVPSALTADSPSIELEMLGRAQYARGSSIIKITRFREIFEGEVALFVRF